MKHWPWLIVLGALVAPGCVTLPENKEIEEEPVPPVDVRDLAPKQPVTPEQVNESNAREMFQRLSDEVERKRTALMPAPRNTSDNGE